MLLSSLDVMLTSVVNPDPALLGHPDPDPGKDRIRGSGFKKMDRIRYTDSNGVQDDTFAKTIPD